MPQEKITPEIAAQVRDLLGRTPRGLEEVVVSSASGEPMVIRVASLVEEKPFPTMFWLVDRQLSYRIDQVEAKGLIHQFQTRVDSEPSLQQAMAADHAAHIQLRNSYISAHMKQRLEALNFYTVLQSRGIGGIADFSRIRCLHTWYASHLVVANTVGKLLDAYWLDLSEPGEQGG
ncbi:MAG: DUF501 domain-containing protein [Halioglobus sp.]